MHQQRLGTTALEHGSATYDLDLGRQAELSSPQTFYKMQ